MGNIIPDCSIKAERVRIMNISIIAAVGKNYELGKNNDLIRHFKEDMDFFKKTTLGATVIMGRKTFESLTAALPKRKILLFLQIIMIFLREQSELAV